MHDALPEPGPGERYYRVTAKGAGMKPNYWGGYVLASSEDGAEQLVRDSHTEVNLGIQGVRHVDVHQAVDASKLESYIHSAGGANEALYDNGEVRRVARSDLDGGRKP